MVDTFLVAGVVKNSKKLDRWGQPDGYDVFHENQPNTGQIDQALCQFTDEPVIILAMSPRGCETTEEFAESVKQSILWSLKTCKTYNGIIFNKQQILPSKTEKT